MQSEDSLLDTGKTQHSAPLTGSSIVTLTGGGQEVISILPSGGASPGQQPEKGQEEGIPDSPQA